MNKQPLLLTAVSVLTFFSMSNSFASHKVSFPHLADPSDTFMKMDEVSSTSPSVPSRDQLTLGKYLHDRAHLEFSVEGFYINANALPSSLHVANATNASTAVYSAADPFTLSKNGAPGGGLSISYIFGNYWDVSASFGFWDRVDTPSNSPKTYYSMTQIAANSTDSYTETDITSVDGNGSSPWSAIIGAGPTNADGVFTVLSSTDTLAEAAELTYAAGNVDVGRSFYFGKRWSLRPYAGLAYRHIGYKDTTSFTTHGHYTGSNTTSGDFVQPEIFVGASIDTEVRTGNGSIVYEFRGGGPLTLTGNSPIFLDGTDDANGPEEYRIYSNEEYVVAGNDDYIGDNLPSYTSKFNGIGPRLGFDLHYSFAKYFSLAMGAEFSMPFASLKTSGVTTILSTENLQSSGQSIDDTSDTSSLINGRNLKLVSSTTFSYSKNKVIPEAQCRIGILFSDQTHKRDRINYKMELGFRVTEDWNALKNVDFKESSGSTAATAAGTYTATSGAYKSIAAYGPYMKLGLLFAT